MIAFDGLDMAVDGQDVDKTVVKTYVPSYQKDEWQAHADDLEMTQSEFLRVMVQAGRKEFGVEERDTGSGSDEARSSSHDDATPGGGGMQEHILDVLRSEGVCDWDQLVERLTDDVESRMDEALQELQRENQVGYSGREGGYTLLDGTDGGA